MSNTLTFEQLQTLFNEITAFNAQPDKHGVTRLAYSVEDEQAHRYLADKERAMGFNVRHDRLGNLFIRLAGQQPDLPAIGTGSHLDSVPNGGAYDGVIGVLIGLYALSQFQAGQLKRSLELIVFRAEESSRFGFACMSSKVLAGCADENTWQQNKDQRGKTYFEVLNEAGYDGSQLQACQLPTDYLAAFIEVHIEQGKVLEFEQQRLGIVTGI